MSMAFASDTSVSVEKTRAEIEKILSKYGASHFGYMNEPTAARIAFKAHGKAVVFRLPIPDRNNKIFHRTPKRGYARSTSEAYEAWEQACRSCWRALLLAIKAKLEAVEVGISSFETEFLAFIVVPGTGKTFGDLYVPQLDASYASGKPTPMLLEEHQE